MNRVVFVLVAILFLLSVSSITGLIQVVKADVGTIIINADGSMNPSTAPIYTADNITYTLTGNITVNANGIDIERNNIVLDGSGYTVTGSGSGFGSGNGTTLTNLNNVTINNMIITNFGYGISLVSSSNCTLSGNNVTNNYVGIWLDSSSENVLSGNNVTANIGNGVYLASSSGNTLSGNNATANSDNGIWLSGSSNCTLFDNNVTASSLDGINLFASSDNNTLSDNKVTANSVGISLDLSSGNTLSGNMMAGNEGNFEVLGSALTDFLQSIDTSNLVDGKPVYYFVNQSDVVVNAEAYPEVGYLGFINCVNVTVHGMNLTDSVQGLLLAYTNDSEITDNNIANNYEGIELDSSSNNTVSGNNVTANNGIGFGIGFNLVSSSGNTLSGNNIANSGTGIWLENSSSDNALSGNNVTANNHYGIYFEFSSSGNTLSRNNITNSGNGIYFSSSDNNTLSGNNVTANSVSGIYFYYSSNNTLSGNIMVGNEQNFGVFGTVFSDFLQFIGTSNLINGKPVYYFVNQSDIAVNAEAYPEVGYLGFVNCVNVTVQGMNLTNNLQGLLLAYTNDSEITGNNIAYNNYGIELYFSSNCTLSGNNVTANGIDGIYFGFSSGNTLSGNNAANNYYGIDLYSSSNNSLSGNNSTANSGFGIVLVSSSGNTLSGNNAANNHYGIWLWSSSNNFIIHNNFVNNTNQFSISQSMANIWDNGSEGNYWSDYLTKYPNATQVDSSGVWNTPYVIDANNTDYYPLMASYPAVPEFPSFLILPLFIMATLLAVIIYKKKGEKTSQSYRTCQAENTQRARLQEHIQVLQLRDHALAALFFLSGCRISEAIERARPLLLNARKRTTSNTGTGFIVRRS